MLRRNGWKGHGPVPWEHEPNRGFLRCLALLAVSARAIGETDEWDRCSEFLRDSSATAYAELLTLVEPGGAQRRRCRNLVGTGWVRHGLRGVDTLAQRSRLANGWHSTSGSQQRPDLLGAQREEQRREARAAVGVDEEVVEQPEERLLVRLDLLGRRVVEAETRPSLGTPKISDVVGSSFELVGQPVEELGEPDLLVLGERGRL